MVRRPERSRADGHPDCRRDRILNRDDDDLVIGAALVVLHAQQNRVRPQAQRKSRCYAGGDQPALLEPLEEDDPTVAVG